MVKYPIYLDYAATTPVDPTVLEAMLPYFKWVYGNAASSTHQHGELAGKAVKDAKSQIAELISAETNEIYFTSGATESINLAIKGVFEAYKNEGNHIVTVKTEHKAVLDTCGYLEEIGADITYLNVDDHGLISLDDLEASITDSTILVCVMYANNETGVIHDIKKIAKLAHKANALFFSDATQAFGKIPINVDKLHMDMMAFNAHKIYGPKGVGGLYINPGVKLASQIHGGGHQKGKRSGTLNVPGIVGLGAAAKLAQQSMLREGKRLKELRDEFENELILLNKIKVNGDRINRLPNISNIQLLESPDAYKFILTHKEKISVSTGSACNSEVIEPSHVLRAMNIDDDKANKSIRISLGKNTEDLELIKSIIRS